MTPYTFCQENIQRIEKIALDVRNRRDAGVKGVFSAIAPKTIYL